MAGETDDPEDAAARLEAALERIARHAGSRPAGDLPAAASAPGDAPGDASRDAPRILAGDSTMEMTVPPPLVEEIAARLDGLIDRLRAALNTSSGGRPG
jgi:hypothetical protein